MTAAFLRRFPVSILVLSAILALQGATAAFAGLHPWLTRHFGVDWQTTASGQAYRFLVSPYFQHSPGFGGVNQVLILFVPLLEWRAGSRLTLAVFMLGDWFSTIPTLVVLRIAGTWSASAMAAANTLDSGSSSAALAVVAALAASLPWRPLRAAGLAVLFGVLTGRVFLYGHEYDYQHLIAAGVAPGIAGLARRLPGRSPGSGERRAGPWPGRLSSHPQGAPGSGAPKRR